MVYICPNISFTDITKKQVIETAAGVEEYSSEVVNSIPLGRVPIMVKSFPCWLNDEESSVIDLGECEFDEGGYFIVSGVEKVLIAQERMSNNRVYVFKQGGKYYFCILYLY